LSEITIFYTNDIHDHRQVFSFFEKIDKNDSKLILDAGDALKGSSTAFYLKEPVLQQMNKSKYDAIAMGNREFNYIRKVIEIRARQATFPFLSANLVDLKGITDKFIKRYIIKDICGVKIGIYGLTPVQYTEDSFWAYLFKFIFKDPIEVTKSIVDELKDKTDMIILLSHLGVDKDKELAEKTQGISMIIGGHTHTLLEDPLKVRGTYIFQAECHGKYVGEIKFSNDQINSREINKLEYNLHRI
jgi:2',3'-cyclic-nucleotide 2'-phosphodiesterase (5'-nucleotidase family)